MMILLLMLLPMMVMATTNRVVHTELKKKLTVAVWFDIWQQGNTSSDHYTIVRL